MSKFESIHIQGFRRLVDVKLAMRPLTVLIGANGCGKTSFLDAWRLLGKAADGKLVDSISTLGGITENLTRPRVGGESPSRISIDVRLSMSNRADQSLEECEYKFGLFRSGSGYGIDGETSNLEIGSENPLDVISFFDDQVETKLSRTPSGKGRVLRDLLASNIFARPFDLFPVRQPQSVRPAVLPGEHGENLVSCLYSFRETDRDRFEIVEDWLHAAFPDFERLDFPPVAAGMLALAWKDRHYTEPIYTHQLSEGTLRFLWLTALLSSRHLPAVTLIDEPEVSLHPQLLMLLVGMMREASMRTQIVVATQSESLVRFLNPGEVLIADLEEGATKFTWGDDLDLDHWLKDFTLNELWTMGVLGGRL